jgi:hypothetical protein
MAEYYPLLAKAIAGLPEPSREARQALYERARGALLNQLRTLQPPVAEADILRETEALANAAARLESEFTAQSGGGARGSARGPTQIPPRLVDPTAKEEVTKFAPPVPPPAKPRPSPAPAIRPPASESRDPTSQQTLLRPLPPNMGRVEPAAREFATEGAVSARTAVPNLPEPPPSWVPQPDETIRHEMPTTQLKLRSEMARPYAPQPSEAEAQPHTRRLWIVGAVLTILVVVIAFAAWKLRDRPEDVARLKPAAATTQAESGSSKIAERIGGTPKPQDTVRPQTTAVTTAPTRPDNDNPPPLPVAQRAALLVEAPDEPNKIKTYVGTVVWRLDNVSNGAGQPLGTAVRADVDIPEAKMKVAMTFQKNFDASLSASHTMTLTFMPAPDSPVGSIKEIHVPLMRGLESQAGDPLRGIPVPIMENSFLIGLSRGNSEAVNLELIKQREWVDIQLTLQANNKIAKLTFEKSTTGARAIEDAIVAWQTQQ